MIQFRLFGFPTRIRWMFWILCVFLGLEMGYLREGGLFGVYQFLILTGTVLVSILWHELGHGFTRRKYGALSEITLWGVGGYCAGPGNFSRVESIKIAAAGPLFNFILGLLFLPLYFSPFMENPLFREFVTIGLFVNFIWGLVNLFPVLPLDGGRIFANLMENRNASIVPWVGLIISVMAVVLSFLTGRYFIGVILVLMAAENWKMLRRKPYRAS